MKKFIVSMLIVLPAIQTMAANEVPCGLEGMTVAAFSPEVAKVCGERSYITLTNDEDTLTLDATKNVVTVKAACGKDESKKLTIDVQVLKYASVINGIYSTCQMGQVTIR